MSSASARRREQRKRLPRVAHSTRPLFDVEQAVSPPADRSKPGARCDDRWPAVRTRHCLAPALEPRRRRAGVQAAFSRAVLRAILQHEQDTLHTKPRRGSFTTAGIRGTVDPLRSASVNVTRACSAVIAATVTSTQGFCPPGCSMPRCARRCGSPQSLRSH